MDPYVLKRFGRPDEVRHFAKGKLEVVKLGGMTLGRASYEPGWKWSEHVGRASGASLCQVEHVGMVLQGRSRVRMQDGTEFDIAAGDLFHIGPGHDAWVVGEEPYVSLHFMGAGEYAK